MPPSRARRPSPRAAEGGYSLLGRDSEAPVADDTDTFLRLAPLTMAGAAIAWPSARVTIRGTTLAAISGAVTSAGLVTAAGLILGGVALSIGARRAIRPPHTPTQRVIFRPPGSPGGILSDPRRTCS